MSVFDDKMFEEGKMVKMVQTVKVIFLQKCPESGSIKVYVNSLDVPGCLECFAKLTLVVGTKVGIFILKLEQMVPQCQCIIEI